MFCPHSEALSSAEATLKGENNEKEKYREMSLNIEPFSKVDSKTKKEKTMSITISKLFLSDFWLSLLPRSSLSLWKSMVNVSTHRLLTFKAHCLYVSGILWSFPQEFIQSLSRFR